MYLRRFPTLKNWYLGNSYITDDFRYMTRKFSILTAAFASGKYVRMRSIYFVINNQYVACLYGRLSEFFAFN